MAACTWRRAWTASPADVGYPTALFTHLTAIALSVSLFVLRYGWMLAGSSRLQHRLLRVLPHVVDTVLLASGVWLIVLTRQYPLASAWLTVKLLAVVVYIVLGSIALRRGSTLRVRAVAGIAALLTIGWIVLVALARHPCGPLAALC